MRTLALWVGGGIAAVYLISGLGSAVSIAEHAMQTTGVVGGSLVGGVDDLVKGFQSAFKDSKSSTPNTPNNHNQNRQQQNQLHKQHPNRHNQIG